MKEELAQGKNEREILAEEILELIKVSVMLKWSYLNTAIGQFCYVREDNIIGLGTDGRHLYYNLPYILKHYKLSKDVLSGDFLHMIIHCVLNHPFVRAGIDSDYWNLAADIVTEKVLSEVMGDTYYIPDGEAGKLFYEIKNSVRVFTAERVYEYLLVHLPGDQLTGELTKMFFRDSHEFWYLRAVLSENRKESDSSTKSTAFSDMVSQNNRKEGGSEEHKSDSPVSDPDAQDTKERPSQRESLSEGIRQSDNGNAQAAAGDEKVNNLSGEYDQEKKDAEQNAAEDAFCGGKTINDTTEMEADSEDMTGKAADLPDKDIPNANPREETDRYQEDADIDREILEKLWEKVGRQVKVSMEMLHDKTGLGKSDFMMNLKEIHRDKVDYEALLKRLSVEGEVMKINDEEFDYVYYSHGISLYRNMPLIEPLEYKEIKAVKEFVIAIDTSASCQGELVKQFIVKTYSLLKQQESFFSKVNVHILQCDEKIRTDHKITSEAELEEYIDGLTLCGFGGTDFRPVFSYVDALIEKKEFRNLKGLVYFTDGLGSFPNRKPNYETVFAFVDGVSDEARLPGWVIPVVLSDVGLLLTDGSQA